MGNEQKVAVITGASRGIGAALVEGYRGLGYRVIATARSIDRSDDDDILAIAGDIADPETAERVISAGVDRFGRIDTLVNNAGIFISKPFTGYTGEDFATVLGVNVAGFFRIIRVNAVSPGVIKTQMHPLETHEALGALHPVGRMGEIADIVESILYLESASFVTGEILHVDGGQSAGH
ncbi:MAG: SDR family oxidoreductase [Mesorhizobium sp.]|nr:MAG: SDR family oxidoreductase [Mesorhizobium sp.]